LPSVVQFTAPYQVDLVPTPPQELQPGHVRVATWYSGISAGTELTAYRGSNTYLNGAWDTEARIFRPGPPTFAYPVVGWGYTEVGQVVEVADDVPDPKVGDVVYGIWGHRSDAVVPAERLAGRVLAPDVDPRRGAFARVGAIALNAILAGDLRLGDKVAIFGQGVIGLLATRLSVLSGSEVLAIDVLPSRLEHATEFGAGTTVVASPKVDTGEAVREAFHGPADVALEVSGNDMALHHAVRSVGADGLVVASGYYQGGAPNLRLGEEFHHNRVRIVASQISGTPVILGTRWDPQRLVSVFMGQVAAGRVDVESLVTDVVDAADVGEVFERLDEGDPRILQVLLRFEGAPA
jgi:2-desacetyl-2-hydroxyethyl bacteriochlorophyllide A dehydrogenase